MAQPTHNIPVSLGDRSYEVHIGSHLLASTPAWIAACGRYSSVVVIADAAVMASHAQALHAALCAQWPQARLLMVPSGEASKNFAGLHKLLETLLQAQPDRRTCLVAVGGGMVGDLVGLTASLLLRGVDFVQIPTTLLAMVDSSVGGKTAINSEHGKNLIGAFYQPRLVVADTATLGTLPLREQLAGYAEVVKYGALGDASFFDWLEQHADSALGSNTAALQQMVAHCVAAKAAIVAEDEREAGKRALLNLGHTLGHALEATLGYDGTLLHGEAVAIGMVFAFVLATHMGMCPAADGARLENHLRRMGLPTHPSDIAHPWDAAALVQLCAGDKKAANGKLTFVLPRALGHTEVVHPVPSETVLAALQQWLANPSFLHG